MGEGINTLPREIAPRKNFPPPKIKILTKGFWDSTPLQVSLEASRGEATNFARAYFDWRCTVYNNLSPNVLFLTIKAQHFKTLLQL